MWLCPSCDAANEERSTRCVVCDRVRIDTTTNIQFCIHCGAQYTVSEDTRYCINCGCRIVKM